MLGSWLAESCSRMAFTGITGLSSMWSLVLQQANSGLFTRLWQGSGREDQIIQRLWRSRLGTSMLSLLRSVGQSKSQVQLCFKGWGKRLHLLVQVAAVAPCEGCGYRKPLREPLMQSVYQGCKDYRFNSCCGVSKLWSGANRHLEWWWW